MRAVFFVPSAVTGTVPQLQISKHATVNSTTWLLGYVSDKVTTAQFAGAMEHFCDLLATLDRRYNGWLWVVGDLGTELIEVGRVLLMLGNTVTFDEYTRSVLASWSLRQLMQKHTTVFEASCEVVEQAQQQGVTLNFGDVMVTLQQQAAAAMKGWT